MTLEEFKVEGEAKKGKKESVVINTQVARLEQKKKELLGKIGRIQE